MRIVNPQWDPVYMKNLFTRIIFVGVFVGMSLLILISTARPDGPGTTPRFWWPIVLGAIAAASVLYWALLKALQMRWGSEDTLGRRLGFEVKVHETGDSEIPDELATMMEEALADGSRRRLTYKVCFFFLCKRCQAE
jgi:hypothetical protein